MTAREMADANIGGNDAARSSSNSAFQCDLVRVDRETTMVASYGTWSVLTDAASLL